MKNRLVHVPEEDFQRCVSFARSHPGSISLHHLLQKLTIFDFVVPIVRKYGPREILEVGCGLGVHSALLSRFGTVRATELQVPGSFIGADGGVGEARSRVFRELGHGSIAFAHNDGRTLPYEDASFDLIFHNSVIEHVPDVEAFNREIRRILRPRGICICITGTPVLCWLRFFLGSIAKLPATLALTLAREVLPSAWLTGMARRILSGAGVHDVLIRKAESRLTSVAVKVRRLFPENGEVERSSSVQPDLRRMYARIQHYIDFPEYNRLVFEEIGRELKLSHDQLAAAMRKHFTDSAINRIIYSFTPRTHGQHYRDWVEEMREWDVRRWIRRFNAGGLAVEDVVPFRFHHIFEAMPLRKWDAYAYYHGARFVHSLIRRRGIPPSAGSEIMIIARRTADASSETS